MYIHRRCGSFARDKLDYDDINTGRIKEKVVCNYALGQFYVYDMPIERCSDQKSQSLREFYKELKKEKSNPVCEKKGQAMLDFLDMIDEKFKETKIWGMTSHDTLVLQAKDGWESGWFVAVSNFGTKEYNFEYRMPEDKFPWPYAVVKGVAPTLNESAMYLAIAMKESNGWPDNKEVDKLLADK